MRQLVLKMETSGQFQKQMPVLRQAGFGEHRKIRQRQWMN